MKFHHIAAVALHLLLAGVLFATASTTTPAEDNLLTKADYPRQSAFVLLWKDRAEIAISGTRYEIQCTPYQNHLGEWEAVETPSGQFISVGENGTTTARIGGRYYTFLAE